MPPRKDIPATRKSKRGNRPPLPFRTGSSASASSSGSASESASVAQSASASSPTPNLGSSSPSLETQTRKRSWNDPILQHYETHDGNEFDDLVPRAICKYCGGGPIKAYAEKGTSNFRRHFETCSSRLCGAKGELILASDGKLIRKVDQTFYKEMGRIYPTSNLYFRCVWKVELLLLKYVACGDTVLMDMVNRMKRKFDKYWSSYSLILSFAMMLDPRYKFQLIQHCSEKLDVESASLKSNHVKEEFMKLFQEYSVNTNEANATRDMIDHVDFEKPPKHF